MRWPHREGLVPCPDCNPDGERGTCGFYDCDLCVFSDCQTCAGLGWIPEGDEDE